MQAKIFTNHEMGGGPKKIEVFLDVPTDRKPKDVISGRVVVNLENEIKTPGIRVRILGEAQISYPSGKTTWKDEETYVIHDIYVFGDNGDREITLPSGPHIFPFTYLLPDHLPSSFKGKFLEIKYTVSALLKKKGLNARSEVVLDFTGILDLRTMADSTMNTPATLPLQKQLGCGGGRIEVALSLPKQGYILGENINFTLEVDNQSRRDVERTVVHLVQIVSYYRDKFGFPAKNKKSEKIGSSTGPRVNKRQTGTWQGNVAIPSTTPPTNFGLGGRTEILGLDYFLKVEAYVSGSRHVSESTPVIIGSISSNQLNAPQQYSYYPHKSVFSQ